MRVLNFFLILISICLLSNAAQAEVCRSLAAADDPRSTDFWVRRIEATLTCRLTPQVVNNGSFVNRLGEDVGLRLPIIGTEKQKLAIDVYLPGFPIIHFQEVEMEFQVGADVRVTALVRAPGKGSVRAADFFVHFWITSISLDPFDNLIGEPKYNGLQHLQKVDDNEFRPRPRPQATLNDFAVRLGDDAYQLHCYCSY